MSLDVENILRQIKSQRKTIKGYQKMIRKAEKSRNRELSRRNGGLTRIETKLTRAASRINTMINMEKLGVNSFIDRKIIGVNALIDPKIAQQNSVCADSNNRFEQAIAPTVAKLSANQALLQERQALANAAAGTDQELVLLRAVRSQQKVVDELELLISNSRAFQAKRTESCNPSSKNNFQTIKQGGIDYWEKIRSSGLNYINKKYQNAMMGNPNIVNILKAKSDLEREIAGINSVVDARVAQYQAAIQYHEAIIANLQNQISGVGG